MMKTEIIFDRFELRLHFQLDMVPTAMKESHLVLHR